MAKIHLIIGPVGAGKSTFARILAQEQRALRLTLDAWMAVLFRPDRPQNPAAVLPWYIERAERCVDQIWHVTESALDAGADVVLEIGLIRRSERDAFCARVDRAQRALAVYLLDAPREVRWTRVARRNVEQGETFSVEVPESFFALASDLWEPPDAAEQQLRRVRTVTA